MQPSESNSRNPKATSSEGTQAAYMDPKIVKLYDKIQFSTGHGINFANRHCFQANSHILSDLA